MGVDEGPVTIRSNAGRNELGDVEATMRAVEGRSAELFVVGHKGAVEERNAEGVLEESGLEDDAHLVFDRAMIEP